MPMWWYSGPSPEVDQLTALARQASAGSNVITSTIEYDVLGRKLQQSDPDAGTVRYAYNAAGEMICSEDARGMATVTDYDALGRAWRVSSGRPAGSCLLPVIAAQTLTATEVPTIGLGASRRIDLTLYGTIKRGLVSKVTRVQTTGDSGAGRQVSIRKVVRRV